MFIHCVLHSYTRLLAGTRGLFTHSVDEYWNGTSFNSSCKIMVSFYGQYSELLMDPYLVFVLRQISSLSGSISKATSIGRLQPLQWAALFDFVPLKLYWYVCTTWISYISVSAMTVPGRTSHRPLSLKPSNLVQNNERVHPFPNFMRGKKKKEKRKERERDREREREREEVKTRLYSINICYHSVLDPFTVLFCV